MSKVYINIDDNSTANYLSDALEVLNVVAIKRLSVPSDFSKVSKLQNIKNDINSVNSELKEIKTWLNNSKKEYNTFNDNLESTVKSISKDLIKKNKSIVK